MFQAWRGCSNFEDLCWSHKWFDSRSGGPVFKLEHECFVSGAGVLHQAGHLGFERDRTARWKDCLKFRNSFFKPLRKNKKICDIEILFYFFKILYWRTKVCSLIWLNGWKACCLGAT